MVKKQINVEVEEEIANYIKNQAHQGRYIEDLVRRDMSVDESLLRRIEALEQAVHEDEIRIDGLCFQISSRSHSLSMGTVSKFGFNVKNAGHNLELQTLADGKTVRTFAFRIREGHFVGRARLVFHLNQTNPFRLDLIAISKIGDTLIVPHEAMIG